MYWRTKHIMRWSPWLDRFLIAIGCTCLVSVAISLVAAASFQRTAAKSFEQQLVSSAPPEVPAPGSAIGRLEIPRLQLSVIVIEGDDDKTLSRAVGHLPGTAFPWDSGNAVLAGHRDTFFRPLKDLRDGDEVRMMTLHGTFSYRVTHTEVVEPNNVAALAPSDNRTLTLITCYPFVYVGRAPQRFVISAAAF